MKFQNVMDALAYYSKYFNPEEVLIKLASVIVTIIIVVIINRLAVAVVSYYYKLKERSKFVKTEWDIKQTRTMANMVRSFVSVSILIIGLLTVLSYFVDIAALLAVAGVGTVAIGFGAKAIVEDLISGFLILFDKTFLVGDYVEINGETGRVENIGAKSTTLKEIDGSRYIVSNGQITNVINYSRDYRQRTVLVSVAYEEDTQRAIAVLKELCVTMRETYPDLYPVEPRVLGVMDLESSGVSIGIISETLPENFRIGENTLRLHAKETLMAAGIEIPYDRVVVIDGSKQAKKG
ncbi:MAG: mechanosensitive ion channel family protein [Eubacteriaceae bacterium]|nr:mechanosensitive ion channel family protein [Eubacteriaceae bacterium]